MENSSCCGGKNTCHPSATKDVVCGMEIEPTENTLQFAYKGKIYYFCSAECKDQFVADPEKHLSTVTK